MTKHLLKLNEIEDQFRELTNKFEEVNFKLDKLSTRVTKIQSDTQLRFSDLENEATNSKSEKQLNFQVQLNHKILEHLQVIKLQIYQKSNQLILLKAPKQLFQRNQKKESLYFQKNLLMNSMNLQLVL